MLDLEERNIDITISLILDIIRVNYRTLKQYPQSEQYLHSFIDNKQKGLIISYEAKVTQAIVDIKSKNLPISGKAISKESGVNFSVLLRWPQLRAMISDATGKPFPVGGRECLTDEPKPYNRMQERQMREENLIARIFEGINIIKQYNRLITLQDICETIGVSKNILRNYPRARQLIHQTVEEYNTELKILKCINRQNDLLQKVIKCIEDFRLEGKIPGKVEVARLVGLKLPSLKKYPEIRTLLNTLRKKNTHNDDEAKIT